MNHSGEIEKRSHRGVEFKRMAEVSSAALKQPSLRARKSIEATKIPS